MREWMETGVLFQKFRYETQFTPSTDSHFKEYQCQSKMKLRATDLNRFGVYPLTLLHPKNLQVAEFPHLIRHRVIM